MSEEIHVRQVVMRGAMATGCSLWAPVIPTVVNASPTPEVVKQIDSGEFAGSLVTPTGADCS